MSLNAAGPGEDRRVMVTGAYGFLGAHVTRALDACGANVLAVVRPGSRTPTLADSCRCEVIECDLMNPRAVDELIAQHRPASCIHLAWSVARPDYLTHADNQRWVQVSLHLAQSLRTQGCNWLGVCGTHVEPTGAAQPPNRYAAAKATLRNRLMELIDDQMNICWWRLFQPYGEGERASRFVPSLLHALARGERFRVQQPHTQRDFIHARDVAAAIVASCNRSLGGVFDLGSGQLHRLRDVATHAARLVNAERLLEFAPVSLSPEEATQPADAMPLSELTGWRPEIDLAAGLRRCVDEFRPPMRAIA